MEKGNEWETNEILPLLCIIGFFAPGKTSREGRRVLCTVFAQLNLHAKYFASGGGIFIAKSGGSGRATKFTFKCFPALARVGGEELVCAISRQGFAHNLSSTDKN